MNNNLAISVLQDKRKELLLEKEVFLDKINKEISSIETSIEELSGKTVWETENEAKYDDENPDYITGSLED